MPKAKKTLNSKSAAKSRPTKTSPVKNDEQTLLDFEDFVSRQQAPARSPRGFLTGFFLLAIIVLGALLIYNWQSNRPAPELRFKAVYLENGEVYYAKVAREDALNIYLDEVYYIQLQEQLVPLDEEGLETETISVPILLKRGSELHQPTGWMQVNRNKVIAIEEIGADSEIIKEINRQKSQ
ncbi:MAG: hypothetical protein PHO91_03700 [Patescibacteria group bacterium]|nr:hypothetical protein [Patescibacteria group bacterium]